MLGQELLLHIQQNIFQEEFLDLSNQNVGDEDVLLLAKALEENIYIKKIKLSANEISDNGAVAIASISTLEEVDISENKISKVGAEALSKSALKKLNLAGNPIGDDGICFFSDNESLLELSAAGCDITEFGSKNIFEKNKNLSKIDFSGNFLGSKGVESLASNCCLEEICLSFCGLSDEGAIYITQNKFLKIVDLSKNGITDQGAKVLANHPTLEILDLTTNEAGDESAKAFSKNPQLKQLILTSNKITESGLSFLLQSPSLDLIALYENPISPTISGSIKKHCSFTPSGKNCFSRIKGVDKKPPQFNPALQSPAFSLKETPQQIFPSIPVAPSLQNPLITSQFTDSQQQTQLTGKRKASELITHPDFSEFFRTASFTQIKQFFDSLKDNCLEIQRKKQKTSLKLNGAGNEIPGS